MGKNVKKIFFFDFFSTPHFKFRIRVAFDFYSNKVNYIP